MRSEKGEIDLFFEPSSTRETREIAELGLLGRMAQTTAIFEPFRNSVTADQIGDCLVKSLQVRQKIRREAVRNKTK